MRVANRTALHDLARQAAGRLEITTPDINEPSQIDALRRYLDGREIALLFVNAGVSNDPGETVEEVAPEEFAHIMATNALRPLRVVETLLALVEPAGAVAIMSSGLGSVSDDDGGMEINRASKMALNTLMRSFAARHAGDTRTLLLIAPGWVHTDMGGPDARLSAEGSVRGVADTIARQFGKRGLHYLDYRGETVRW